MTAPAGVTVVAVTYNSADVIAGFLRALKEAATDPVDLVIVDNKSADDTVDIVTELTPTAAVIRSARNAGFAAGINLAIEIVKPSGPVLVVNPDVRLHPGAIDVMLATAQEAGVGIVVPQLRDENGKLLYSLRRDPTPIRVLGEAVMGGTRAGRFGLGEMITTPGRYEHAGSADWATGACMLITPECRRRVGPWDDTFFLYSEETDYALRARDAGLSLRYQPAATATHRGGDAHRSPALFQLLTVNRWQLYRRRHGPIAATFFRAALIVDMLPRAVAGRPTARAALTGLLSAGTNLRAIAVNTQ
ncbi:MAG: glycosyltransferase family 2 protein [Mycobacterium sp.]|nr:glycosyltransferase family 2 protein [Mycobacterium sp.]